MIYAFESSDKYEIEGVGTSYITYLPYQDVGPPLTREKLNQRLVSRVHILNDRAVLIRGVETYTKPFIDPNDPISLLIRENMEIKYNDQILDVWTEEDAKWQITVYEAPGFNSDLIKGIFKSIEENLAMALTDPSPYTRYVANYLSGSKKWQIEKLYSNVE